MLGRKKGERARAEEEFSWRGGRRGNHGRIRRMYKDRAGCWKRVPEGLEQVKPGGKIDVCTGWNINDIPWGAYACTEMAPPPRRYAARVAATPLAAGCWFITNKDYSGNGTFCPFGCSTLRTSYALTHAFARLLIEGMRYRSYESGDSWLRFPTLYYGVADIYRGNLSTLLYRCDLIGSKGVARGLFWYLKRFPWFLNTLTWIILIVTNNDQIYLLNSLKRSTTTIYLIIH